MTGKYFSIISIFIISIVVSGCATTKDDVTKDFPEMRKIYTDGFSKGQSAVKASIAKTMSKHPALGGALRPVIPIRRSEFVEWVWVPNRTDKIKDRFVEGHRIWYVRRHASWWKDKVLPGMVHVASLPKAYNIPFERVNISIAGKGSLSSGGTIPSADLSSGLSAQAVNNSIIAKPVIEQPPGVKQEQQPLGAFQ